MSTLQDMKILIIDDDITSINLMKTILEQTGYKNIFSATTAKAGLELAGKTPPDLIVLDIFMPEIEGFEVCQRLKTDKVTMDIPVIMITGGGMDLDKALQKTFEVGAIDFITKPIRSIEFLVRIKSVLTLKQAHEELRETKDYLENILDSSLDGIIVTDPKGYITRVNYQFVQMIGCQREEIIGKQVMEFAPVQAGTYTSTTGEVVQIDENFFDDVKNTIYEILFKEGKVSNQEIYFLRKDGKIIPAESNIFLLYDNQKNTIGSVDILRDITDRKQAEKALQESNERMEEILFSLPTGNVILDTETKKIVGANPKAISMIGAPLEQIIGSNWDQFILLAESEKFTFFDIEKMIDNTESVLHTANGEKAPIYLSVIPITVDNKKSLILSFIDISEQKRLEQERIQKEKLEGALEMAGAVCHELNQPLMAVAGYSEIVMSDLREDNPLYDSIKNINEQVDRMGNITRKLMGITKYETKGYMKGKIIDIDKSFK